MHVAPSIEFRDIDLVFLRKICVPQENSEDFLGLAVAFTNNRYLASVCLKRGLQQIARSAPETRRSLV